MEEQPENCLPGADAAGATNWEKRFCGGFDELLEAECGPTRL